MELLFVKTEKGFAASKYGKMMFPNRNSKINSEGVYECEIVNDKGNYAFVDGIKKNIPKLEDVADKIKERFTFEDLAGSYLDAVYYGEDELIILRNGCGTSFIEYMDKHGELQILGQFEEYSRHCGMPLYSAANRKKVKTWDKLVALSVDSLPELPDIMKCVTVAVGHTNVSRLSVCHMKSIKVYDNRLVRFETATKMFERDTIDTYYFCYDSSKKDMIKLYGMDKYDLDGVECEEIAPADVEKYIIENHIYMYSNCDGDVVEINISEFGRSLTVYARNVKTLIMSDISDDDKKKISESFKDLESFRKYAAKNLGVSAMDKLRKLTDKQVLKLYSI